VLKGSLKSKTYGWLERISRRFFSDDGTLTIFGHRRKTKETQTNLKKDKKITLRRESIH